MNMIKKEFVAIIIIGLFFFSFLKAPSLKAIEFDLTAAQNSVGKRFASKFCEAKEKYLDTNVYFKEFLGSLTTASSKEDLKNKIKVFSSEQVYNNIPEKMINKFIHSFDGKSGERIVNEISRKD